MRAADYRPDIDGLRALAVLAVVFFHADFELFKNGFLGVDVFFVISGFLITRIIREAMLAGTFSFAYFYERRARRLLPALYFIYALSFITAYHLLGVEHFRLFGDSLLASIFFVSNIHFYLHASYFDPVAIFKPLLHTWSLSVEEQFYLVWPLVLLLILKTKRHYFAPLVLLAVGMASLIANGIFKEKTFAIFYLIHFRAYELCLGAVMVWLVPHQPRKSWILEPMLLTGLGLIALAIFGPFYLLPYPFQPLPACVGTALVLYSGTAKYCGRLLSNRMMVFIGLVSYSLYLTHWPAFVFYKYYRYVEISTAETWLVIGLSFALSVFMYRYIETPFRSGGRYAHWPRRKLAAYGLAAAALIASLGGYVWHKNGVPKRVPPLVLTEAFQETLSRRACANGYGICKEPKVPARYVMIGDSEANGMLDLMGSVLAKRKQTMEVYAHLGCLAVYKSGLPCEDKVQPRFDEILSRKIPNLVLSSSWNPLTHSYGEAYILEKVKSTVETYRKAGVNVYVTGSMPIMYRAPSSCFERPFKSHTCTEYMTPMRFDEQRAFNEKLKQTVIKAGAKYLDFFALLCKEDGCRVAYEGLSLYADRYHFTNMGGFVLLQMAKREPLAFDDIFKPLP